MCRLDVRVARSHAYRGRVTGQAYHPAIAAAIEAAIAESDPLPTDWDVPLLRALARRFYVDYLASALPPTPDVTRTDIDVPSVDGTSIGGRWYVPPGAMAAHGEIGSAVVYAHGGGMVAGSAELHDPLVAWYAQESGVPFLSVDYRLAPENPGEGPVEDSFAALRWLSANAGRLGVDPARIAVMGDSAGGGIAAGTAILARDRVIPLARQILVYPMLDDRTLSPDPVLEPLVTWTYEMNVICWQALLGDDAGGAATSGIAAPARNRDLAGLADVYIEVGDLDIFRDEGIEYARRLASGGAAVELHVHAGAPHGYDWYAPASDLADRWRSDRLRVIRSL